MSDESKITCDAIVTFEDAERWANELYPAAPDVLETRMLEIEPAVLGVAADLADRLHGQLTRAGVNESIAVGTVAYVVRTAVICTELTRRGYRRFLTADGGEED